MVSDQNDYNKAGFVAFVGSMVFTIGFFVYVSFVHKGVDLKEVEQAPVSDAPVSAAPVSESPAGEPAPAPVAAAKIADINTVKEPWIATPELVEHGRSIFALACATCHGEQGKGDGPAGKFLTPPPRNMIEGKWKYGGDSISLFNTITKGVEGTSMAPFGYMPVGDRWALVHFVRSLTTNKVADDSKRLAADAPNFK